jgi:flagellar basal-body rod protein FlgF
MNSLEIAAISMQLDQQRLATIAHNVANSATPAFKRSVLRADGFAAAVQAAGAEASAAPAPAGIAGEAGRSAGVLPPPAALDLRAGTVRWTGAALDIAIEGEGFIELVSAQGRRVSRGGSLQLDASGRLVTAQGWAVLGRKGEIQVAAPASAVSIDGAGVVRVNGQEHDQIQRVRFESATALVTVEPGVYDAAQAVPAADAQGQDVRLRSGYLEASNVNTAREMVQLMETTRHYESMQRALQAHDEMLERALRTLGEQGS